LYFDSRIAYRSFFIYSFFQEKTGENDHNILQEDLQKMEDWSNNWLLKFHPEKCKYMNITRTKNEGNREYQLLDQNITKVNEEKDIGVTIDSLLSFELSYVRK
jgi:ribosomal protein L11 methylase PrmA